MGAFTAGKGQLRGLGVCTHLERRHIGWKAEALVPLIRDMGASMVRQGIVWGSVEREKGVYAIPEVSRDWVRRVAEAGLGVIPILCYGNDLYENPLDPDAYANYARYMAKELRGAPVVAWEIWNEPTNFEFLKRYGGPWSAQPPCEWADRFCELLAKGAAAIREVDDSTPIITNPGECQFAHMAATHPEVFALVDGVSHHSYPMRFPPETTPWGGAQVLERDGVSSADDRHGFESIWTTAQAHARERLGREIQLYMTEYGYSTYNHRRRPSIFCGYTEAAQEAYLARGVVLSLASGLRATCVYDFMDNGVDPFEAEENFGLVRHEKYGFEPKPSYAALSRLAGLLGPEWELIDEAPARLEVDDAPLEMNADEWQRNAMPVERYIQIAGPHVKWFAAGGERIAFVWNAGRLDAEFRPPLGQMVWQDAPPSASVEVENVVTGARVPATVAREDASLVVSGLPVSGELTAVRWRIPSP